MPRSLGGRGVRLDSSDQLIVEALQRDGRIGVSELAREVGLAPSSCRTRVRALLSLGIIRGFTVQVDPVVLGYKLQVLIHTTIRSNSREGAEELILLLQERPEVQQVFVLGGPSDLVVHLAVRTAAEIREFVTGLLSAHPSVVSTRTSMIFDHHRNPVRMSR